MKKLILSTLLFISLSATFAQSEKYVAAMKSNLELLKNSKTPADLLSVSAAFERIATVEKTQWQPYYYAALAQLNGAMQDPKADKDAAGIKVDTLLSKAEVINKNSELSTLHYYCEIMKMTVDPQSRYMTAAGAMEKYYQQAVAQDSANPRIYFMKAQTVFHTPETFGGGKAAAKPIFQKSVDLFSAQKTSEDFLPKWGKEEAEAALKECSE
ncbi:MAG: hypothetical protein PW786_00060 [Arachidicoccus sp.]|nr:hypothetical protein [Arachidicoccus sp.]